MLRAVWSRVAEGWVGAIGLVALLLLWQIGSFFYNPVVLPSPLDTLRALIDLSLKGRLLEPAVRTVAHALGGYALAAGLGTIVGIAAGLNPPLRKAIWPVVSILQGMPVIAWIVLALLWFGTGDNPPVFAVALSCLPIVFVGAIQGVVTVDRGLLQMASAFRAPLRVLLGDLYLPHLLSYLFPAMLSGLGLAWKVALTAELLASEKGIGADFGLARVNLNMAEAMAWVLVMLALMFAFEYLLVHPLQRWLEPWRREEPRSATTGNGRVTAEAVG